jgi:hypothetical protein
MTWTDPDGATWTTYPWAGEGIAFGQTTNRIRIGDLIMPHSAWTLTEDEANGFENPDDPTSVATVQASLLRSGINYAADLGSTAPNSVVPHLTQPPFPDKAVCGER